MEQSPHQPSLDRPHATAGVARNRFSRRLRPPPCPIGPARLTEKKSRYSPALPPDKVFAIKLFRPLYKAGQWIQFPVKRWAILSVLARYLILDRSQGRISDVAQLYLTVFVTSAMLVSGVAVAQPPRNPPPADRRPAAPWPRPQPGAGKYLAIPGLFPLSMSGVQREIGLTPDQRQQLKAVSDGYMATTQRLGKTFDQLDPAEKPKQGKDFADQAAQAAQAARQKAEAILNPQQLQTVKKIAFELSATGALADPNMQKSIGLNAEQQQRLAAVYDKAAEKMQQLQRDTAQQVMQVLDEDQAAALRQQMEAQRKPQ